MPFYRSLKLGGDNLVLRSMMLTCLFLAFLLILGCSEKNIPTQGTSKIETLGPYDEFSIAGSGANLHVTEKLAEAYSKKTGLKIHIPGSIGSDGAINAVQSGHLELGLISRPLTPSACALGLKELPYARVAIVFASHIDAPNVGFSSAEIIDILKGTKTTWSDGTRMHILVRQEKESANLVLYDALPGYKEALFDAYENHRWQIVYRDRDMSEILKEQKGAFGLTITTELAKEYPKIKPLDYNGIAPTTENIRNGTYTLTENLSFVYKDPLSNRASTFLDYVFSEEGRSILDKWGTSPLGR